MNLWILAFACTGKEDRTAIVVEFDVSTAIDAASAWKLIVDPDSPSTDSSGEELTAEECWTLGPFEERLGKRQAVVDGIEGEGDGREPRRVALRSLFARAPTGLRRALPILR